MFILVQLMFHLVVLVILFIILSWNNFYKILRNYQSDLMFPVGLCATVPKLGEFLHKESIPEDSGLLEPTNRKRGWGGDGCPWESQSWPWLEFWVCAFCNVNQTYISSCRKIKISPCLGISLSCFNLRPDWNLC